MILVRDIFQIKFGQAKEATALWKQLIVLGRKTGYETTRMLTDLAGPPFYTLVLESTFESTAKWEQALAAGGADPKWRELYAKVIPLTESGRREIFKVIE